MGAPAADAVGQLHQQILSPRVRRTFSLLQGGAGAVTRMCVRILLLRIFYI